MTRLLLLAVLACLLASAANPPRPVRLYEPGEAVPSFVGHAP